MKDLLIEKNISLAAVERPAVHILIFKTNIRLKKDLKALSITLGGHPDVIKWNVDICDKDKVLRVESYICSPFTIISLLGHAGFYCEELVD